MKSKIISSRCYNQDQSWYFERVIRYQGDNGHFTLKVHIRRNSYNSQSHAQVSIWDGFEWSNIVNAPISECVCKTISYTDNNVTMSQFEDDEKRLLEEALLIVT
jgi:hypothetical protein